MSKLRWISVGLTVLVVVLTIHFAANNVTGIKGHTVPAVEGPSALVRSLRPNFPYSVIPGGAYTPGELQFAHSKDEVVRTHYADFNVKQAKLVTLTDDRFQYASYRIKDQIYWTKKKLRIPKGDLLLTDGASYARARCGNRLSDTPHPEAVNSREPEEAVLSMPPVSPDMLPKMALADPPVLGGIPAPGSLPTLAQTGAAQPGPPATEIGQTPGSLSSPYPVVSPAVTPVATGFAPAGPMGAGGPIVSTAGTPTGTPPVTSNPITPVTSTTPSTTGSPAPTPPGTPVSAIQPPSTVTPIPEPSSIYLFLLSFVISVWALMRMTPKDKSER